MPFFQKLMSVLALTVSAMVAVTVGAYAQSSTEQDTNTGAGDLAMGEEVSDIWPEMSLVSGCFFTKSSFMEKFRKVTLQVYVQRV